MAFGRLPRRLGDYKDLESFAAAVASQEVTLEGPEWLMDDRGKEVIRQCLSLEKAQRPAAMTLLRSPWFQRHG